MKFTPLKLADAYLIESPKFSDNRGFLITPYCHKAFEAQGIEFDPVQSNLSHNKEAGTLRGLHFQTNPHAQAKLVSCLAGKIIDVLVDLRPESETFCQWEAVELSLDKANAVFIPKGFAHGFQTLEDNSLVYYLMDTIYAPDSSGGYCYDDPNFKIQWPLAIQKISEKDRQWPAFSKTHVMSL